MVAVVVVVTVAVSVVVVVVVVVVIGGCILEVWSSHKTIALCVCCHSNAACGKQAEDIYGSVVETYMSGVSHSFDSKVHHGTVACDHVSTCMHFVIGSRFCCTALLHCAVSLFCCIHGKEDNIVSGRQVVSGRQAWQAKRHRFGATGQEAEIRGACSCTFFCGEFEVHVHAGIRRPCGRRQARYRALLAWHFLHAPDLH